MIRFAPTLGGIPHLHIGHLFNHLAAKHLAAKLDKKYILRLDLFLFRTESVSIESINQYVDLFPADEVIITTNNVFMKDELHYAYLLSHQAEDQIFRRYNEIPEDKEAIHGWLRPLVLHGLVWDHRHGITDIVRDRSMRQIIDVELEFQDILGISGPKNHHIPTLTYNGKKIEGRWYGQYPRSLRLTEPRDLESTIDILMRALDKAGLSIDRPDEWIKSDIEEVELNDIVPSEINPFTDSESSHTISLHSVESYCMVQNITNGHITFDIRAHLLDSEKENTDMSLTLEHNSESQKLMLIRPDGFVQFVDEECVPTPWTRSILPYYKKHDRLHTLFDGVWHTINLKIEGTNCQVSIDGILRLCGTGLIPEGSKNIVLQLAANHAVQLRNVFTSI